MIFHRRPNLSAALALLVVTLVAYGLLIPWLGFYSDDWLFLWIGQKLGTAGLERYFTTNRPFWGLLFQATMPLLGSAPVGWHLFALFSRWLNGLAAWELISLAWPSERYRAALWTALLLLVYPGYKLQPVAITFGHLFLVLTFLLASLACSLLAVKKPARAWLFSGIGLLLSAANLLMMEYFFVLELLRPLLIYLVLPGQPLRARLWLTFRRWLPYLVLFLFAAFWRAFFFNYQTHLYKLTFADQLAAAPLAGLLGLLSSFFHDLFVALVAGWGNAFSQIPFSGASVSARLAWAAVMIFTTLAAFAFLSLLARRPRPAESPFPPADPSTAPAMLVFALAWLALAGLPFLLTGLRVEADWIYSRFTLPYILGSALLIAALLAWLQQKLPPAFIWLPALLVCLLVGLSAGNQLLNANTFRADWAAQQALYWQMVWRIPSLQRGTTLLINDQNSYSGSPTYLTAAANWFYAPGETGPRALYQFLFTRKVVSSLPAGELADQDLSGDYLGGIFTGRGQDVIVLVYNGRCLRVLDPKLDAEDPTLDDFSARAAPLSQPERIAPLALADKAGARPFTPDPVLMGREPEHGWCYWSAQADLARQRSDWNTIVRIGDEQIQTSNLSYKTAATYLPFIEGYAHLARWETALSLSTQYYDVVTSQDRERSQNEPGAAALICHLWQRIDAQTPSSTQKTAAIDAVRQKFRCAP